MSIFKVFQEAVTATGEDGISHRATLAVIRDPKGFHSVVYARDDRFAAIYKNRNATNWPVWEGADEQFLHYVAVIHAENCKETEVHIEFERPELREAGHKPASAELIKFARSIALRRARTGGRPN